MDPTTSPVIVRLPRMYARQAEHFAPPSNQWMIGTWHITHSTLPLWKGKRNVAITYELLPADAGVVKIDDLVKYQAVGSAKVKSVHGVDKPTPGSPGAFEWRGKGWLSVTSSQWECIGWGNLDADHQFMVSYFAKTLFTPAGIDIYSRRREGLPEPAVNEILAALQALDSADVKTLASSIFEIPRD